MTKHEATFQILFKHWAQAHYTGGSAGFELKRTLTHRFYIPNIAPHQVVALNQAYNGTLYHKIADDSIGTKPFDCFILQNALAYVVIAFGPTIKEFFLIPIWVWNTKTKGKKSVTDDEVRKWKDVEVITVPKRK